MTIKKVKDALDRLSAYEVYVAGEQDEELVQKAERLLGHAFPDDYRHLLCSVGAVSFGSMEVYGICGPELEMGPVPNGIAATLQDRADGLPDWFVVLGAGELGIPCLDLRNSPATAPVIAYHLGYEESAQTHESMGQSFGEYFSELVDFQIELFES